MKVIHVFMIPVPIKMWKHKDSYVAVVTDKGAIQVLQPFIGRNVIVEIEGIEVSSMLRRLQFHMSYVGVVLPKRLNPTWERMRKQNDTYTMVIKITKDEELNETSNPAGSQESQEVAEGDAP